MNFKNKNVQRNPKRIDSARYFVVPKTPLQRCENVTEEEVIFQLKQRHRQRQQAIQSRERRQREMLRK